MGKITFSKNEIIGISIVFLISVFVRLHINFSTDYFPGGNGAYYLVAVRNILERGSAGYADFPLVFSLEAVLAYIIINLGLMDINSAVDFSCRIFDSIVPVFSIIPAYLTAKSILGGEEKLVSKLIIASVSVLYIYFFTIVSDFQKNALGLLWLNWLIYWLLRTHEYKTKKNIAWAAFFFFLTAITHYGCTGVAIALVALSIIIQFTLNFSWKRFLIAAAIMVVVVSAALIFIYLLYPIRFRTLIQIPFSIFDQPVLFYIFKKEHIISLIDFVTIIMINIVVLFSAIQYCRNYKTLSEPQRTYILTITLLSLFLASPFLSLEYAQRLYFISYVTTVPLLAFICVTTKFANRKKYFFVIILFVLVASTSLSVVRRNYSNMNSALYKEMINMKSVLHQDERSLIVARHGFEFWSTWIFRNMAVRQETLSAVYWRWYDKVYFIVQKKDKAPFGPAGTFGKPFSEPVIPEKSSLIYSSDYFDLYLSMEAPKDFSIFNEKHK
ncbi:MAG: hypothetical protein FD143_1285 [Ignavibacteria bacterium]|nr:MAG: hypothetical protein FD143_1285 [Ignavibacteria bacterium]KAF0160802.1 MAG: hypothetical protein FD188_1407 [Ignavibacteria bacterium]